jgi:hypothetical protein
VGRVVGVARRSGLEIGKLGGHRFAEDQGSGLP